MRGLIETEPDMSVAGEAGDGEEAVARALALRPDVMVLDLLMPGKDGVQVIREVVAQWPEARILVLTSFAEDERVIEVVRAGALGYLLKDSLPCDLLDAIREVARGNASLPPAIARKVMRGLNRPAASRSGHEALTVREREVLALLARGLSNQQMAERLVVSERTIRCHVSNILRKLQLTSRTQAALHAQREGFTLAISA